MPLVPDATGPSPHPAVAPNGIGWSTLTPTIVFTSIAFIVVVLRWYTRAVLIRAVGHEDSLITLSMILSFAYLGIVSSQQSIVKSEAEASPSGYRHASHTETKLILAGQCIYLALTNITKASILTQYLRIFHDTSYRILRLVCHIVFGLLVVSFVLGILWGVLLCRPVKKLWEPEIPGKCTNSLVYWTAAAGINTGLDFFVWAIPMPVIGRLRLPRRQMLWLSLLFLVGGFTCVVGIVRIARVRSTAYHRHYTESGAASVTWSAVESNTGIICASLICVKPLIIEIFPNMLSSQGPSRRNLQLPTIDTGDTQNSNTWTCSTYVDSGRGITGSEGEVHPTASGINVTFETVQTSEVNSSREADVESTAYEMTTPWAKSWEEQDRLKGDRNMMPNRSD